MGKIKKILETELVGGTQSTDVYPVTSTKAVYDENNVRLDTILKPATKEAAGLMSPEDKKNIDDKLSKSEGGEVNKPIVVTNENSNHKITLSDNGTIEIFTKNYGGVRLLTISPDSTSIIFDCSALKLKHLVHITDPSSNTIFDNRVFYADKYKINNGTNKQVLLGDGSTISSLLTQVSVQRNSKDYSIYVSNINGDIENTPLKGATEKLAGLMTAADKAKLDDIENTYLPLSGGKMTGPLNIDFTEGIKIIESDLSPRNTYICDGSIRIEQLDGDSSSVISKTEINSDGITTPNATIANKIKANGFLANNNGNYYTAWTTNGESIDLIDFLSNAAIYVAGGFELAESGIDNTTVVDSPNSIIYDGGTRRFLARKGLICYTHWKADISKNIAPPSRYGIETDNGVFPFNNQMYKFSTHDNIFIATCSNGTCNMKKLTLE